MNRTKTGIKTSRGNESPYKLFCSEKKLGIETKNTFSISAMTPKCRFNKNRNQKSCITCESTKCEKEVSLISKRLKSMTLSNELYTNYINYYCNLTQEHCFKIPRVSCYPVRKNQKYLPITYQQNNKNNDMNNYNTSTVSNTGLNDNFFLNFGNEQIQEKKIITKPYGFKYGDTKIRIDRKRAKSAFCNTITPKEFQNLCETNIFETELLKQIGLKKIDMYNCKEENSKNFDFFRKYMKNFKIKEELFNFDNSYKNISFNSKTSILKQNIHFNLEIYSMCFKFYLLGTKEKPQKLYVPFPLMPMFYLLDYQLFKVFLSEIIYYNSNKKCFDFVDNNLLTTKIKKYCSFVENSFENNKKYLNYITYNKNELCFYLIYDWIVTNDRDNNYKSFKLKISLPKIKFYINSFNITIKKHLNKHIIANILIDQFKKWEKFILFDLFSNKKFKIVTNLIMLNKQSKIAINKIRLNRSPNKEVPNKKNLEFYLTESDKTYSHFYIFQPYIILVLLGEKKKRYQKINLSLSETKNLIKYKKYWGTIGTLLKCMFIDNIQSEVFFRFDLLDNINNDLYNVIIRENYKKKQTRKYTKKFSSTNSVMFSKDKERDKEREKNKTKYKASNLEIVVLDCTLKKINIMNNILETKYYKIPDRVFISLFSFENEKKFDDISLIGRCVGEYSKDILYSCEENILNEIEIIKKKAKDSTIIKLFDNLPEKNQHPNQSINKLKTLKSGISVQKDNFVKKNEEQALKYFMPTLKLIENKNEKIQIKFPPEIDGFRVNNTRRNITINNFRELNRKRISSESFPIEIK